MLKFTEYLTEKDHRPTITKKIGMPQEVADYLHGLHDKRSIWFANQIAKMPNYQRTADNQKLNWVQTALRGQITAILDWMRGAQNVNLNAYDWDGALQGSEEWHDEIAQQASGEFVPEDLPEGAEMVKSFPDGFYWIDLNETSCGVEGRQMGHCGTTHDAETLMSLRSPKGEPHVTLAISPEDGAWHQCKGKGNRKPDPKYYPYIAQLLAELEVYNFKAEYNRSEDFDESDFRDYVEANEDDFPEGTAEKIEDSEYGRFEEAEKRAEELNADFEHGYVSAFYDEYAYIDGSFTYTFEGVDVIRLPEYRDGKDYAPDKGEIEEVEFNDGGEDLLLDIRLRYGGYENDPVDQVESVGYDIQELENDYAKERARIAEALVENRIIRKLPYDLELVDEIKKPDEDLDEIVDNNGVEVFNTMIDHGFGTSDIEPIADSLIPHVKEVMEKIIHHNRGEQLQMNFEAYTKTIDLGDLFTLQASLTGRYIRVQIFFDANAAPKDKQNHYATLVRYLRTDAAHMLIKKRVILGIEEYKKKHIKS